MSRSSSDTKSPRSAAYLFNGLAKLQETLPRRNPDNEPVILLVDDDPAVLSSLARVLMAENWEVVTAKNGEEALELLTENQPDLLITDLNMGEVSGWDLLFHENIQRPHLPIFVVTALPPPLIGGADRFATHFFQKPLDLDALLAAVRQCLGGAAAEKTPPDPWRKPESR